MEIILASNPVALSLILRVSEYFLKEFLQGKFDVAEFIKWRTSYTVGSDSLIVNDRTHPVIASGKQVQQKIIRKSLLLWSIASAAG